MIPPVHVFCGTHHYGPICPGGWTTCCLCFEAFQEDDLADRPGGGKWDMCKTCGELEAVAAMTLIMAGRPMIYYGDPLIELA